VHVSDSDPLLPPYPLNWGWGHKLYIDYRLVYFCPIDLQFSVFYSECSLIHMADYI